MVGRWFGVLFLATGAFSLFGSAMGIIDYTSRLAADILKTTYLPKSSMSESRMYFWLVWGMVGLGCASFSSGCHSRSRCSSSRRRPAASIMFLYSMLLIALNKKMLPAAIRISPFRTATLLWSTLLFGSLAMYTIYDQAQRFLR